MSEDDSLLPMLHEALKATSTRQRNRHTPAHEDDEDDKMPTPKRRTSSIIDDPDSDLEITGHLSNSNQPHVIHDSSDKEGDRLGPAGKSAGGDQDEEDEDLEAMWRDDPATPRPLSPGLPSLDIPSSPQTPSNFGGSSYSSPPPASPGRRLSVQLQQKPAGSAGSATRVHKFFFSERDYRLYSVDAAAEIPLDFRRHQVPKQPEVVAEEDNDQSSESGSDSPSPEPSGGGVAAPADHPPSLLVAEEHAVYLRYHQLLERGV